MSRFLIKGGFVIPVNGRKIIKHGCVLVEDDVIAAVRPFDKVHPEAAGAELVNGEVCVIIPG